MSSDWARARSSTRRLTLSRSTAASAVRSGVPSWFSPKVMPSSPATSVCVITSAVAIRVLLGTQSVSTADPPIPSLSTTVTSASSWAATSAAS